jgi:hypothetical protein
MSEEGKELPSNALAKDVLVPACLLLVVVTGASFQKAETTTLLAYNAFHGQTLSKSLARLFADDDIMLAACEIRERLEQGEAIESIALDVRAFLLAGSKRSFWVSLRLWYYRLLNRWA